MTFEDHAFFTHDWNKDQEGRDNHARVREVAAQCKARGLKIWFDEDKMSGNIVDKMCDGIDGSAVVVVFVTKNYLQKVAQQERADDNCKLEFNYALRRRRPTMMIAVVMEQAVRDTSEWRGAVGMALGNHLYIDMSSGSVPSSSKIDELIDSINSHVQGAGISVNAGSAPSAPSAPSDVGKSHTLRSAYGHNYVGVIISGSAESGIGEFTCSEGNEKDFKYVGPFEGHTMVGSGTMIYDDGSTYEGERAKSGKKHGKGTYTWASGNRYEGDWVDGDMTGIGTFTWKESGSVYHGEYQSDKRHGKGKITRTDGTWYDGMWKEGNKHGHGKELMSDGHVYNVTYDDDNLQSKSRA